MNNHLNDFQTPQDVAKYMVSLLPAGVKTVLEPTKGLGTIVNELRNYKVTAPADYFNLDPKLKFDAVVMNPPFSSKSAILDNAPDKYQNSGMKCGYMILYECMMKSDTIIALMPWYTISDSDVRMRAIKKFGLKSITVLPRKTFEYARIQTCILELNKGFTGNTVFNAYEFMMNGKEYREPELVFN